MYNCGNRFRPTDIYDYDNLEDTKYNTQSGGADLINTIERNLDDCTICAACSLGLLNNNTGPLDPGMQNYDPIQVQELPLGSTLQTITSQSS